MKYNYNELSVNKRFPRYHCHEFEDDHDCSYKFLDKFESREYNTRPHDYNIVPDFNPLEKAIFDTRQGPFDIYDLDYVLNISRGFLISKKLKSILAEYRLCNHVIFDKIKYTFKGELRDDLSFIYFCHDFSDKIDYSKSSFYAETSSEKIIEEEVSILSSKDYDIKSHLYSTEKKLLIRTRQVCCPEAMQYDIFSIMYDDEIYESPPGAGSVFISERLLKRLKQEKIRGLDYEPNMTFGFGCKTD